MINLALPQYFGRNAHRNGPRRYVPIDHRSGAYDASLSDRYTSKHNDVRAKPHVALDHRVRIRRPLVRNWDRSIPEIVLRNCNRTVRSDQYVIANRCIAESVNRSEVLYGRAPSDLDTATDGTNHSISVDQAVIADIHCNASSAIAVDQTRVDQA